MTFGETFDNTIDLKKIPYNAQSIFLISKKPNKFDPIEILSIEEKGVKLRSIYSKKISVYPFFKKDMLEIEIVSHFEQATSSYLCSRKIVKMTITFLNKDFLRIEGTIICAGTYSLSY